MTCGQGTGLPGHGLRRRRLPGRRLPGTGPRRGIPPGSRRCRAPGSCFPDPGRPHRSGIILDLAGGFRRFGHQATCPSSRTTPNARSWSARSRSPAASAAGAGFWKAFRMVRIGDGQPGAPRPCVVSDASPVEADGNGLQVCGDIDEPDDGLRVDGVVIPRVWPRSAGPDGHWRRAATGRVGR